MKRLDLIIDALDQIDTFDLNQQEGKLIKDARIAARSLRDMEPVIWKSSGDGWSYEKPLFPATPLYALRDEK